MKLADILALCDKNGLQLSVQDGALRVVATGQPLSEQIKRILQQHKSALIQLLDKSADRIIERVDKTEPLVASFAQQRIWMHSGIVEQGALYNSAVSLSVLGSLDTNALQRALATIVERHQTLRTVFIEQGDELKLSVLPAEGFAVSLLDLSDLGEQHQQLQVEQLSAELAGQAFDLSRDMMLRVQLVKLSDNEHVLLGAIHHIATDAWSSGIFVEELNILYKAHSQGLDDPLPAPVIQYSDFARWQQDWLQGEILAQQMDYWLTRLEGLPEQHSLPLDKVRSRIEDAPGALYSQQIDSQLTTALTQLAQDNDATLYITLQTAFMVLLSRFGNSHDVVVGSAVANRLNQEVESLIGCFINTLVHRCHLSDNPRFCDLLQRNKANLLADLDHQAMPFELLVEKLNPARDLNYHPLAQIMFGMENFEEVELSLNEVTFVPNEQDYRESKFDISVHVTQHNQGLQVNWGYTTALFEAATIERMAAHYLQLLRAAVASPQATVSQLGLELQGQRNELPSEVTTEEQGFCLHQLIEQQASETPDKSALIYLDQSMSYGELNQQANQLAHYLLEQGLKPDSLVAVCMTRGPMMVVAMLAVLKAGGDMYHLILTIRIAV